MYFLFLLLLTHYYYCRNGVKNWQTLLAIMHRNACLLTMDSVLPSLQPLPMSVKISTSDQVKFYQYIAVFFIVIPFFSYQNCEKIRIKMTMQKCVCVGPEIHAENI